MRIATTDHQNEASITCPWRSSASRAKPWRDAYAIAFVVLVLAATCACTTDAIGPEPDAYEALRVAPVAVTPMHVVDEMLMMAGVGPGDFVVDLGSGDGRLVIAAVERFRASGGFGVDISGQAVAYANARAAELQLADRIQFFQRDLFATDVSRATVVTVYLFPTAMPRLRDKLRAELAPGARVVSHDFPFPDWHVDRVSRFSAPDKNDTTGRGDAVLYLYTVPVRTSRP